MVFLNLKKKILKLKLGMIFASELIFINVKPSDRYYS